jgi:hypothetical protein
MTSGFRWVVPPSRVFPPGAEAYQQAIRRAVFTMCQFYAPEIEAWMKQTAPWTDRTGNARQSLSAFAEELTSAVVIELGHGVDYGRWLEWRNSGSYAIIAPALDEWGPRIMQGLLRLFV